MFSFLVEITQAGRVTDILWSDPDTMVPGRHASLYDFFEPGARDKLANMIKECARGGDAFACDSSFHLTGQKAGVLLCMAPSDKHALVFAAEERNHLDARNSGYIGVIRLFMRALRAHSANNPANLQADMIQTLAKELINRKRQLEDTNTRMNIINEDLSNRLVKDALTGLVSRYQYRTEIEYVIAQSPRKLGVFIFIDVDNFKGINDRYGHAVGDTYLVEFAERLKRLDMPGAVRMRISGDEFGLFIYGLDDVDAAMLAGFWRIFKEAVLSRLIEAKGYSLPIAVSAGMAVYGIDTLDVYELIEYADFAMYTVKRRGKNNYGIFDRDEYHRVKG